MCEHRVNQYLIKSIYSYTTMSDYLETFYRFVRRESERQKLDREKLKENIEKYVNEKIIHEDVINI